MFGVAFGILVGAIVGAVVDFGVVVAVAEGAVVAVCAKALPAAATIATNAKTISNFCIMIFTSFLLL